MMEGIGDDNVEEHEVRALPWLTLSIFLSEGIEKEELKWVV